MFLLQLLGLLLLLLLLNHNNDDWICFTVIPDDNLVKEPFEDPCYELSGTRTPPTPDVAPSHAPPPPAPSLLQHGFFIISTWVVIKYLYIYTMLVYQVYSLWSCGRAQHQWWCDLCSSFLDSSKLWHENCGYISFFSCYYYWGCCNSCDYCAGKCSTWDIVINNGAFVVLPDSVWYELGLLLCSATAQTDTWSKIFDCALVSTLEVYGNPGNGKCCNYFYYCHYCHYNLFSYFIEIIVIIDVFVIMLTIELFDCI